MNKFWNFTNQGEGEDVVLRIDGDIIDDDDAWLYEWLDMKHAAPNAFRNELAQYAGKNIAVWIDSYGGSVFAAAGIYNALMEHKKAGTGCKVTTIVDGKAMSAATTIFMAGDERMISPCGLFMMHNPLARAAGYATDLRKAADILDVVKECIVNAYQVATGLSVEKISAFMDDETYMSAKTAIKNGFATAMQYVEKATGTTEDPSNSMELMFNRLAIQNAADDSMKNFVAVVKRFNDMQTPPPQQPKDSIINEAQRLLTKAVNLLSPKNNNEEDGKLDIKTIEDLKKAYPDMVNQIANEAIASAVAKDKERVDALNALAVEGNQSISQLIEKAKNSGKTAEDIKDAVDIMKQQPTAPANPGNKGEEILGKAIKDSIASGVNGVESSATPGTPEQVEEIAAINYMGSVIAKKCGKEGAK